MTSVCVKIETSRLLLVSCFDFRLSRACLGKPSRLITKTRVKTRRFFDLVQHGEGDVHAS